MLLRVSEFCEIWDERIRVEKQWRDVETMRQCRHIAPTLQATQTPICKKNNIITYLDKQNNNCVFFYTSCSVDLTASNCWNTPNVGWRLLLILGSINKQRVKLITKWKGTSKWVTSNWGLRCAYASNNLTFEIFITKQKKNNNNNKRLLPNQEHCQHVPTTLPTITTSEC